MSQRLCRICGKFHDLSEPWPWECRGHFPAPPHGTLNIISDTLDYVMNPADGRRYSSKAKYYAAVRAKGCEIVGNENVKAAPRPQLDDPINDIRRAIEMHANKPTPRRRRKAHG